MQDFKKYSVAGSQQQQDFKIKPLSIQTPDVHEALRLAGVRDLLEDEQSAEANKLDNRRRSILCCCGVRGCSIGPMTQYEEN